MIHRFDPTIRVIGASNGIEVRNLLLRWRPQLAFVNLQLPRMTGAEALAWAVARQVRPFSVVMSSAALPKWIELSLELGAYDFLRTPLDPTHVTHIVEAFRRMTSRVVCSSPTARSRLAGSSGACSAKAASQPRSTKRRTASRR